MSDNFIDDCFDLDHSRLILLIVNSVLTTTYLIIQTMTHRYFFDNLKSSVMIRLYKLMMIVNVLMVVPFAVEAVRYRE